MLTRDIAKALSGRLEGDGSINVDRLVHPDRAERPSDLAVAMSVAAAAALRDSKARAVVISADHPACGKFGAVITVGEGRTALATLTALFDRGSGQEQGVHPTAVVAPEAEIADGASIGAYVV